MDTLFFTVAGVTGVVFLFAYLGMMAYSNWEENKRLKKEVENLYKALRLSQEVQDLHRKTHKKNEQRIKGFVDAINKYQPPERLIDDLINLTGDDLYDDILLKTKELNNFLRYEL